MKSTFSVAMCTYNGSRFVSAQLESIAAQTRLPTELVVCDDASTDDTVGIVQHFAASAPFPVRVEVNTRNIGSTKNFDKAIQHCEGQLIALADQDDVWLPRKLELIEAELQRAPNVGLVFSDAELVDEHLRPLGQRLWKSIGFDESRQTQLHESSLNVLLPGWTVTGATMAFRSKFRTLVLPIPDELPMIHDGWIAAVISAVAEVSFIDEPLIKYRQHPQQQVGVPDTSTQEKAKLGENLQQAIGRSNTYSPLITICDFIRSRLVEHCEEFDCTTALQSLDQRIGHLRTRQDLPSNRLSRLPDVVRELLTRRYQRFSNGFYSALKDLLTRSPTEVRE
ncbi:MAG TPA: glycosyltransferase family 2 protein [Pyrinomonadaceae bacterium]